MSFLFFGQSSLGVLMKCAVITLSVHKCKYDFSQERKSLEHISGTVDVIAT